MRNNKVYVDSSVYGGVFDTEFERASLSFFAQVRSGIFRLMTSVVVHDEIETAPDNVRDFFHDIQRLADRVAITRDAVVLQSAYLKAGILTAKSENDALHVALATTGGCAMIVSWNFKHIVHYDKIPLYNAVNILHGYDSLNIFSPLEVIDYDEGI